MSDRYRQWAEKVERQLKGSGLEELVTAVGDELEIKALYPEELPPRERWALPGSPPFTRGGREAGDPQNGCVFCPEHDGSDPETIRSLFELERSRDAGGIWLRYRGPAAQKAAASEEATRAFLRTLAGWGTSVFLDAGSAGYPIAALLLEALSAGKSPSADVFGCLGHDPLGALFAEGGLSFGLDEEYHQMAELADSCRRGPESLRAALVSTRSYHEAGATPTEELAYALATGTEYARRLEAHGMEWPRSADQIVFSFQMGGFFFLEIAKLRAARLLWSKVGAAAGKAMPAVIHARTSRASKTKTEVRGNLVRTSVEAAAAILGGAELLTVAPFDEAVTGSSREGHRLAANTSLILTREAGLSRVLDPGGGSAYLEEITEELARKAWRRFQAIEEAGGMGVAVGNGEVGRQIKQAEA